MAKSKNEMEAQHSDLDQVPQVSRADAWQGRRVLVTGGSGFIGQHLVLRLVGLGAEVTAVSRRKPEEVLATDVLGSDWLSSDSLSTVHWRHRDLSNADEAESLLKATQPAVVFHLAGLVKGSRERSVVRPMLEANLMAAIALMDAACESGCERFVQAGSLEEAEDLDSAPASPYALSKTAASLATKLYRDQYELSVAVARIFMVYGPGPQDRNKLVPYVIQNLLAGTPVQLSSGTRPVDWIYVEDVVDGLLALASSDAKEAELGSGELHTVREVVERIAGLIDADARRVKDPDGAPPAQVEFGGLEDRANERVRVARVGQAGEFDWRPQVTLDQGLARTIDWFKNQD